MQMQVFFIVTFWTMLGFVCAGNYYLKMNIFYLYIFKYIYQINYKGFSLQMRFPKYNE